MASRELNYSGKHGECTRIFCPEIDAELLHSRNVAIRNHIDHLDNVIKCEYIIPLVKLGRIRPCEACLNELWKQARNHYLISEIGDFTKHLYLNCINYTHENYVMKNELRTKKRLMCDLFGTDAKTIEMLFRKYRGDLSGMNQEPSGSGDDGASREIKAIVNDNRNLENKIDLLDKETDWLNEDIQRRNAYLLECNRRILSDQETIATIPNAKKYTESASKMGEEMKRKLKKIVLENKFLDKQRKKLINSGELKIRGPILKDPELRKLIRTRKLLAQRLLSIQESNHDEFSLVEKDLQILTKDNEANDNIYKIIISIMNLRIGIINRVEKFFKEVLNLTGESGKSNQEDDENEDEEEDETENEPDEEEDDEETNMQWDLNSLLFQREKLKALCIGIHTENEALEGKVTQLSERFDEEVESLLNLQKQRLNCALEKEKLKKNIFEKEAILKGMEFAKIKYKSNKRLFPKISQRKRDRLELTDVIEDNELLNVLILKSVTSTLEDFSLYRLLMENIKERFVKNVNDMSGISERLSKSEEVENPDVESVEDENQTAGSEEVEDDNSKTEEDENDKAESEEG